MQEHERTGKECHLFHALGIPLHPEKLEGLSTCMTIPDIELDWENLQPRLPKDKFNRITALVEVWSHEHFCKQRDLKSLIGHLQHACKFVPQGQSFLRCMINLLCTFHCDDHPIRLNQVSFFALNLWTEFFKSWSGYSFLQYPQWPPLPDFHVSSDGSGVLGYGAMFHNH